MKTLTFIFLLFCYVGSKAQGEPIKSIDFLIKIFQMDNMSLSKGNNRILSDEILTSIDSLLWPLSFVNCDRNLQYDGYCYFDGKINLNYYLDISYIDSTKNDFYKLTYAFDDYKLYKHFKREIKHYLNHKNFEITLDRGNLGDEIFRKYKLTIIKNKNVW